MNVSGKKKRREKRGRVIVRPGVTESPRVLIPQWQVPPLDYGSGCCKSVVLQVQPQERAAAAASVWGILEMQVLRLHPRPAE